MTDEDIVDLYLKGETENFKILIDRYGDMIYNFSLRFVGADTAEDVSQDVFIKAWRGIKKFDKNKAQFKTWLFTIARNTITDYLRKKKTISFNSLDESFIESIEDENPNQEEIAEKIENSARLAKALENIPINSRLVLTLYYQEDMTFEEIGRVLGKPLNTVKSQHRRALLELKKMVL